MANGSKYEINLKFNADTTEVQKQLQQLMTTLNNITSGKGLQGQALTTDLNKAVSDASKLQAILKNTTLKNGNLDLGAFRQELKKSNLTVDEIGSSLMSLGPKGAQAFSQLSQSILSAEIPLKRTSALLSNFATTLKNTAKWQISSSLLHGFMGSIQSAYGYAQDLNESLNNIRIVSKQNTEQMAEFAEEANKAAKSLSISTTAYTDAALIFYQQGLQGEAVTERTDVVAKMSNVTKDSVEEVSSYMTAIWNNFDDGSESLEHYADVITGLGAATASSSAEIAAGLEKFAAVADTVGLSYDYATSALATVVAQTRQSADTVGTAFKTLFARIEGLKLGETLDDGVDLNKYSEALNKVGVSILDANGQLKDMDKILDDLGARWDQLDKASQVALAQTVAGTRQYNQLVALLDNWEKVQENLQVARGSEGELQKQQDIYAEGWEAAQKRVKAAAQTIYKDLLDDKFFINLSNSFASVLNSIDKVIKSLGGLKTIIPALAVGLMSLFNKDLSNGINNFIYNLQAGTKTFQEKLISFKEEINKVFGEYGTTGNVKNDAIGYGLQNQLTYQQALIEKQKERNRLGIETTEIEKSIQQAQLDQIINLNEELRIAGELADKARLQYERSEKSVDNQLYSSGIGNQFSSNTVRFENGEVSAVSIKEQTEDYLNLIAQVEKYNEILDLLPTKTSEIFENSSNFIKQFIENFAELDGQLNLTEGEGKQVGEIFNKLFNASSIEEVETIIEELNEKINNLNGQATKAQEALKEAIRSTNASAEDQEETINKVTNAVEELRKKTEAMGDVAYKKTNSDSATNKAVDDLNKQTLIPPNFGKTFTAATSTVMSFGTALRSIDSLFDTLLNKEASFGDKLLAIFTTGAMSLTMLTNSFKNISSIIAPIVKNAELLLNNEQILGKLSLTTLAIKEAEKAELEKQLAAETDLTAQVALRESIEAVDLSIEKLQTTEGQKQLTGEIALNAYKKGELGFASALLVISKAETKEDQKQLVIALLKEGLRKTAQKTVKGIKVAVDGIKTGVEVIAALLGTSAAVVAGILAGLVVIAAVVAGIYKNYKNDLKTAAEEDRKHLDTLNEKKKVLEEEADQLKKLSDEYKNLIASQNDLSPEELKNQVYNLCIQYGQEKLAIEALSGAYDKLEQSMANLQKENAKELEKSAERTKNAAVGSARSNAIAAAGSRADDFGDTIDLEGLGATFSNTDNGRLKKSLQDLGLKIDGNGKVDTDQLVSAMLEDSEAFQKVIESSNAKAAKTLKHIYDAISNEIGIYDSANETLKEVIATSYDTDSIHTIEDYNNAINALAAKSLEEGLFKGDNAEEEARKWAKQALNGISDEIDSLSQKNLIVEALVGKDASDEVKNKVLKTLESLPKEVSEQTIAANINLIKILGDGDVEKGVKKFAEKFGELIEHNTEVALGSALENTITKEDPINEEDINQLYEQGFNPGMSQAEFTRLDTEQQLLIMTNYYTNIQGLSEETRDKVIADLQSQIDEMTNGFASAEEAFNYYTAQAENAEMGLAGTYNLIAQWAHKEYGKEWEQAYIERLAAAEDELTEEEKANKDFIEDRKKLEEFSKGWKGGKDVTEDIKGYKDRIKQSEEYKEALTELNTELNNVKSGTLSLASAQIALEKAMKLINEKTDNIQQGYQNLINTVKEYNENGFVTMDTLQQLWQMDDQYLASLELVNGQLQINEKTFEILANSQIDTMEAEALLELQTTLLTNAENEEANTASAIAIGGQSKIGTLDQVISKVKEGIVAWREYAAEQTRALTGKANLSDNQKNAVDAFYNKINLAESFRKQIGTKNFGAAMNASSGKSGGGGGKDKETKELKEYADEFDRFYPYQKVIDDVADAMNDLAKAQDHMAGGELVGALRKQNRLLQEQKKAYQDLAKEQKAYQKEMQTDLAKYGVSFDTYSGNIVNYADATNYALEQYNAAIEKYNKSAQSDADKKALEAVEKEYEKFKKLLSNYQNILTEIQDTENNLDDIYYETIANNLKEFEIMLEVKLDIGEARRMVNDFISEINRNFKTLKKSTKEWLDLFDTALKNAHTYVDGDLGTINVDLDALNKVRNAIDTGDYGHEGAMFASETEAITKYKELAEQLKDDAQELYELYKDAWDDYLDAVDEAIEEWEDLLDDFDEINDILDHYEKIIELSKGTDIDERYELLAETYQKQIDLSIAKQATLRKQVEALEKEYQDLINAGAKENDADVKKIKDAIDEANKSLQSSIEAYLETIQKQLDNSIEIAKRVLEKSLFGTTLDKVKEEWEDAKKEADKYYDSVSRIYELDKLKKSYTDVINDTQSLKLKKQLAELQDKELKKLAEKEKLSKADIEIAQKRLEVEQARIALEEAQENKSQMRLRRDSQGNWSYQFVADEENIEDKEQNLNNKIEEWRQAAIDARKQIQEEWLALFEEYETKYIEILEATRGNEEERDRQLAELKATYIEQERILREEAGYYDIEISQATIVELEALYIQDQENYQNMTEYEKALIDDLKEHGISSYDELFQFMLDYYGELNEKAEEVMQNGIYWWDTASMNAVEKTNEVDSAIQQFFENVQTALEEYDMAVARSEEASGIAWSNVRGAIEETGYAIDEVSNKVEDCVARTEALSDFRQRVNEIESAWYSVKRSIEDALTSLDNYLLKLLQVKDMQDVVKRNATAAAQGDFSGVSGPSSGSGNGGTGGILSNSPSISSNISYDRYRVVEWDPYNHKEIVISTGYTSRSEAEAAAAAYEKQAGGGRQFKVGIDFGSSSANTNWSRSDVANVSGVASGSYKVSTALGSGGYTSLYSGSYEEKKKSGSGRRFATGGYTGEWGEDARWALLDQKELVLNASDTKNILDAVQTIRGAGSASGISEVISQAASETATIMAQSIDMITQTVLSATHAIVDSIAAAAQSDSLEQNVHIDASFPNVTNREEIEGAFNNLVNIASQRVSRIR